MNVSEKILEEIKRSAIKVSTVKVPHIYLKAVGTKEIERIIRRHMDDGKDTDVPTNNGWIPCSERLPEESLDSVIGWDMYRERCVFVQHLHGRWIFGNDNEPVLITAWRRLPEPYKPAEPKQQKNTQQELEDFWRDK